MSKKSTPKRLLNNYTGEVLLCDNPNEIIHENGYRFIWVYTEDNPYRKFLVNKDAFSEVKKS